MIPAADVGAAEPREVRGKTAHEGFIGRVEVFYPDALGGDEVVGLLCPQFSPGGAFLLPEEKTIAMHRLLKGSSIRHGSRHTLVMAPLWLWNAFLHRSAELVTGAIGSEHRRHRRQSHG